MDKYGNQFITFLLIIFIFLQLYELDDDPERKTFLDDYFEFMKKRGEGNLFIFPNSFTLIFRVASMSHFPVWPHYCKTLLYNSNKAEFFLYSLNEINY